MLNSLSNSDASAGDLLLENSNGSFIPSSAPHDGRDASLSLGPHAYPCAFVPSDEVLVQTAGTLAEIHKPHPLDQESGLERQFRNAYSQFETTSEARFDLLTIRVKRPRCTLAAVGFEMRLDPPTIETIEQPRRPVVDIQRHS